jgi:hypothetical protein
MFVRPRDLEPISEDLNLVLEVLIRLDAKLDVVRYLLGEDDDGEEEASGP